MYKFVAVALLLVQSCLATTFLWNPEGSWQRPSHTSTPICVDIPVNMSLCHGIGYTKMRLPNLLHHDSLQEVSQQAVSWIPLFQLGCHPDTQLFLCSLFTPVCLDHPIPPCRSLCTAVQNSCESTMRKYGYPWPHLVRCDQFPVDNDMCITAQHSVGGVIGEQTTRRPPTTTAAPTAAPSTRPKRRKNKKNRKNQDQTQNQATTHHRQQQELGHRHHQQQHHHREPDHRLSTMLETTPRPVHHHLQPMLPMPAMSHRIVPDPHPPPAVAMASHPNDAAGPTSTSGHGPDLGQKSLQQLILTRYCHSDWSLKARASSLVRAHDGRMIMKLRNFRVLHGKLPTRVEDLPSPVAVEVIVPANLTGELEQRALNEELDTRKRYYLMGQSRAGSNMATLAIPWPHKMGQFRKALKIIKSGRVNCPQGHVQETTTDESGNSDRPDSKSSNPDQPNGLNAELSKEQRQAQRAEERKRRKEERRRHREERRDRIGADGD